MKKIVKVVLVVVMAAMSGYGVYTNIETDIMSGLMLANTEALADAETVTTYAIVITEEVDIWDDNAGEYKKVITYKCKGSGTAFCE